MKITNIETFVVDAGWRPWLFVKVETDEGITGWGECSDGANPMGIKGTIEDLKQILVGKDPREFEKRFGEMYRMTRQSPGGIASKAIAGLDCAFIDIKARALGISVAVASRGVINHIEKLIGTFREAVGSEVDINLDLNFHFKPESCLRIAKVLEQFDMLWLEIDMYQPESLRQIKDSTTTRICTGENLFYMRDYLPYFQNHAADMFMIDVPWNGFSQSKKVGDLAEVFQHNVAPHNYYSHLSTFISATLCAVLPNVRIMEIDIDDVPWKDDLTTDTPEIINGYMTVPTKPGWGVEIDEDVARAHPWQGNRSRDGSAQIPSELLTGLPSY